MLTGIHHLALTVTDVERSAAWYIELLSMVQVIGEDSDDVRYRVLAHPVSGMVIGLRQYPVAGAGDRFDEMRTGMDHVAIGVESSRRPDGVGGQAQEARHHLHTSHQDADRHGDRLPGSRQHPTRILATSRLSRCTSRLAGR